MYLSTYVQAKNNRVFVHWATRGNADSKFKKSGVISMPIEEANDPYLLAKAEASALWDLLVEHDVCNANRSGKDLYLEVSHSALINIFDENTESVMTSYANALRVQFFDACVSLNTFTPSEMTAHSHVVQFLESQMSKRYEVAVFSKKLNAMVNITFHALQRWRERMPKQAKYWADSLKKMIEVITERNFYPVSLPENVQKHKSNKYLDIGQHYSFLITQGVRCVMVDGANGSKSLVTLYNHQCV